MSLHHERVFLASDGERYRARLGLFQLGHGLVLPEFNRLCFESWDGRWIGSVPVDSHLLLVELYDSELDGMLGRAREAPSPAR